MDGDSLRRQLENSVLYAETHGLELDTTLRDLGVSAFDGSNIQYGALGVFLEKVQTGEIAKGSILLVESLDRLSRDYVDEAYDLFRAILKAGIVIVTLVDGQEYSRESIRKNWVQIIISLAIMSRAHEESATKARRLREAWIEKRKLIHEEKVTARAPHWLILSKDRKRFSPDPKRVPVVERIFREYIDGIGQGTIAARLNKDKIPSFGKAKNQDTSDGWHGGTVSKIIPNRAVTGWYQPHRIEKVEVNGVRKKVRVPVGDPIPDYYPRIIDDKTWLKAQQIGDIKRAQYIGTGRKSNGAGPKGLYYSNIFTGFSQCGKCGAAFIFKPAGVRSDSVLRCSKQRRGMCDNDHREKYDRLESAIIEFAALHKIEKSKSPEVVDLEQQIAAKQIAKGDLEKRIERIEDAIENGEPMGDRLTLRRAELDTLKPTIEQLQKRLDGLRVLSSGDEERRITFRAFAEQTRSIPDKERYAFRARIAQRLREVIARIIVHPDRWVEVKLKQHAPSLMFMEGELRAIKVDGKSQTFGMEQVIGRATRDRENQ